MAKRKLTPPFKDPQFAANYEPSAAGRRIVQLDEVATGLCISLHRGRNSRLEDYALLSFEGMPRQRQPRVVKSWKEAIILAIDEHLFIYNPRSKKCSRPVWYVMPDDRTLDNMTMEEIRPVPHEKTYFDTLPYPGAKIFHIEI